MQIHRIWQGPKTLLMALETLPAENFHCAELAVGALCRALINYHENQRTLWKKLYPHTGHRPGDHGTASIKPGHVTHLT